MMLPKLDAIVLLTNEGHNMDKKSEHWSMIKHGEDDARKRNKNRVYSGVFSNLEPPLQGHGRNIQDDLS
jgi:hypothetical protein